MSRRNLFSFFGGYSRLRSPKSAKADWMVALVSLKLHRIEWKRDLGMFFFGDSKNHCSSSLVSSLITLPINPLRSEKSFINRNCKYSRKVETAVVNVFPYITRKNTFSVKIISYWRIKGGALSICCLRGTPLLEMTLLAELVQSMTSILPRGASTSSYSTNPDRFLKLAQQAEYVHEVWW